MTVFIAIGIILSAAVACCALGARLCKAADSRGFTLQTLIVTAMLVLVAVGVTVVFIALTRGNRDDLEGASRTDFATPEEQYGVLTPDGDVSKTWRCALHQEPVLSGSGRRHLECKDRCWGSLSDAGKKKWNTLFPSPPHPSVPFGNLGTLPPGSYKAIFSRSDFDGIVYSESNPGSGYPKLDSNGTVIALTDSCIMTQEICDFPPSQRESLLRRWRTSVEATETDGLPTAPAQVSELFTILDGCT